MKILPRQLRKENYSYFSSKSVADLKGDFKRLFDSKWYDFSTNLDGEFKKDDEFIITKKITFWSSPAGNSYTLLKGKLSSENRQTRIDLTVIPNPIVNIFTFVFPIFGLMSFYVTIFSPKENWNETLVVGIVFTFLVPIASAFYSQFAKNDLRNKFVETFKLTKM